MRNAQCVMILVLIAHYELRITHCGSEPKTKGRCFS